jgi:hypothetical protein
MKDKKKEIRKRRAGSPLSRGTSSKLLVIKLVMSHSEAAIEPSCATGWVDLLLGHRFLPSLPAKNEGRKITSTTESVKVGVKPEKAQSATEGFRSNRKITSTASPRKPACMKWCDTK